MLRSLRRYSSQGASLYVYRIETAAKETDKPTEWKETVSKPVSTTESDKVISESCETYEIGHTI